jgi:hypothetical protein
MFEEEDETIDWPMNSLDGRTLLLLSTNFSIEHDLSNKTYRTRPTTYPSPLSFGILATGVSIEYDPPVPNELPQPSYTRTSVG